ncbi:hypothetical protein ORI20_16160 [Mycobacterium sp. CVI_P3]|uniref:DUF4328 domain-containing protein n=1 Tax=Mycobacterium pinniadriaticum TaxID=2994102 RepID=A0ABT3SF37_9MYCO|nr:hypothetical protein [Mycobacterium pinniadriaticum]MCX2931817.1 hypothetical protein [Mycobacterium pinniadriaticum]MCX2938108.1 hypothetical protein [Mycobacterium pinniadriaticum]
MNARTQRLCAWCAPALMVIFFIGFWLIARFIPPPSPAWSAAEIADFYRQNSFRIKLGITIAMWSGMLCTPWVIALGLQMKRIEGRWAPLALTQMGLGILLPMQFMVPFYFFLTGAYRNGRSDEAIQTLNDLGWLPFAGLIFTWATQCIVFGIAVIKDKHSRPIFPRWSGYLSLWCGIVTLGSQLDVFFTDGPLAWNGAITWWLLLVVFFVWMLSLTYVMLQAINDHEKEYAAEALSSAASA